MKVLYPVLLLLAAASVACSLTAAPAAAVVAQPTNPPTPTNPAATATSEPTATSQPGQAVCVVAVDKLNVRAAGNAQAVIIGYLYQGDQATISQTSDGWAMVTTPSGLTGWVNSKYCK